MAVSLPAAVGPGQTHHARHRVDGEDSTALRADRAPSATFSSSGSGFRRSACWILPASWNCHQFHVGTEFFSDFGVYDVRMTVPRGWLLAATGRERERTDNPDGTTTHRYYQEDVHDFAWTTSPDYVEHRETFRASRPAAGRHAADAAARARWLEPRAISKARAPRLRQYGEMVRRLSLRPHHHRRSGLEKRDRAAWSIRRSSRLARPG